MYISLNYLNQSSIRFPFVSILFLALNTFFLICIHIRIHLLSSFNSNVTKKQTRIWKRHYLLVFISNLMLVIRLFENQWRSSNLLVIKNQLSVIHLPVGTYRYFCHPITSKTATCRCVCPVTLAKAKKTLWNAVPFCPWNLDYRKLAWRSHRFWYHTQMTVTPGRRRC